MVPHVSHDEEPIPEVSKILSEFDKIEDNDKCIPGLDYQCTVLPKLRRAAPLYFQVMNAWREGKNTLTGA
jgi:hypothetical protein